MIAEEVIESVEENGIEKIQLQFTDILGVVKNVSIPAQQITKAFDEGIYFDGSSIEGFVRIQESDMHLVPDPMTYTVLPWKEKLPTARLICDVHLPDGTPFPGDPRRVLKRATEKAAESNYTLNAGPEAEFFAFEVDENGKPTMRPHDTGGYFDLGPKDQADELRGDITGTLQEMGFEVEASHHEVAEGQHEIDFKYSDAVTTADNLVTFRMVVRAIAQLHGLHATFMPKPIAGINGSGMHTHLSLFENGTNAFHDPEADFYLSDTARSFLAGLLDHAPAIAAVTNPLVNSYKRLVPGYEAPIYIAWSDVNRSALVRVPATRDPEGTRFELRSPDPSCNPYLAFAVMLTAGLDGIDRELEAPEPVRENIYELTEEKRIEHGIDVLPGNLNQAIQALRNDEVVLDALGEHVAENLIEAKTQEWDEYKAQVSSWEVERYFESF